MSLYHIPHRTTCLSGAWSMKGVYVQWLENVSVGQKRLTGLIVYSEVLWFQVTLALVGIIVSCLVVYCRRQQWTNQNSLQIIQNLTRTVDLEPRKTWKICSYMCPTGLRSPHVKSHLELKITLLQTFVLQPVGLSYVFKVNPRIWMSTQSGTDQFSDVYKSTLMSTHMTS